MTRNYLFLLLIVLPMALFSQNQTSSFSSSEDLKNGYYKETNGNTSSAGYYIDGKKNGMWADYNDKDLLRQLTEYKDDVKHGISVTIDRSGYIEREDHYVNGILDGECRVYLRGNYLNKITTYKQGVLSGVYKQYYTDKPSVLMEESYYNDDLKDGRSTYYNQDGKIVAEYDYTQGMFNGVVKIYHDNGFLKTEEHYDMDVPVGEFKEYFDDGNTIKIIGSFKEGVKDGIWYEYDQTGKVVNKMKYVKGTLK